MKPRKLFSQLFPTYFFISLIGLVILIIISRYTFRNFYIQETKNNLTDKAYLIQTDMANAIKNSDKAYLKEKIKKISTILDHRLTVILPDGRVIADSDYDINKMENHKEREEIQIAISGKVGSAMRNSPTLGENFLYVAVPLYESGKVIGVLRNAVSARDLHQSLSALTTKVLIWSTLLLLVLTYFIYAQAKRISAPLEAIKLHLEKFSLDRLEDNILVGHSSTEEIDSLYKSIHKMSSQLRTQYDKITKQRNEINAVFSSMLEGVVTILPDLSVYHINSSALRLFNRAVTQSLKGTPLFEVVKDGRICELAEQFIKSNQIQNAEINIDGKIIDIHISELDLNDSGLKGAVIVFDDITKMRKLESHRTQFVANVSHELKTPLTVIQGYVETLKENDIEDPVMTKKFINIIDKHTQRLKTIVEDLLSLSSLEKDASLAHLEIENISSLNLIKSSVEFCQESARKKNITLTVEGKDFILRGSRSLMEQALINLLDNAIKYAPLNSDVVITSLYGHEMNSISVSDEGAGIAAEHLPRLFERFYSVDKARSRELGGSGLGLAIVKHIVKSHHGEVAVESVVNKGTTFSMRFPVNQK